MWSRSSLLDLAGPAACASCGARRGPLCPACRSSLGGPDPAAPIPGVDAVLAPLAYEGGARALVLRLKLGGLRAAADPLSAAMAAAVQTAGVRGEVVTWVPGRSADIRARGYDHAAVLAGGLARRLGLPAERLLRRSARRPADQTSLGAAARRANLEGAFVGTPCRGRRVIVVDDLVTTGATAGACAAALRAAGACRVEVIAPCRA